MSSQNFELYGYMPMKGAAVTWRSKNDSAFGDRREIWYSEIRRFCHTFPTEECVDNIPQSFRFGFGFVAHLKTLRDEARARAPFNKVGLQMKANVIAMSILASGYLGPQESVDYMRKLPKPVSCVVAVSSEVHAKETFSLLPKLLSATTCP